MTRALLRAESVQVAGECFRHLATLGPDERSGDKEPSDERIGDKGALWRATAESGGSIKKQRLSHTYQ